MNLEQEVYLKIPKNRVGALIGKDGQDKLEIEELTGTTIEVDSGSGDVTIYKNEAKAFEFYRTELIVKSIGRGFSPMHAKFLLDDTYTLEIIDLTEFGNSSKSLENKRGRVIGSHGMIRKFIEDTLDCYISVQGKTISIIGKIENIHIATSSINELLNGSSIPAVKKHLIRQANKSLEDNF